MKPGTRIRFVCDMKVGHEGVIPKNATGIYRGISDDPEQYLLFEMDEDHGFLQENYGYPNCFLGDAFCVSELADDLTCHERGEIQSL